MTIQGVDVIVLRPLDVPTCAVRVEVPRNEKRDGTEGDGRNEAHRPLAAELDS